MPYQLFADAVLLAHFGVVAFVVGGLVLVVVGNGVGWAWVKACGFVLPTCWRLPSSWPSRGSA